MPPVWLLHMHLVILGLQVSRGVLVHTLAPLRQLSDSLSDLYCELDPGCLRR